MKKIFYILVALTAFVIVLPGRTFAQGMMNFGTTNTSENQNLSDDEYENLGEQWMQAMMGENHEAADEQMKSLMGEDFLRQMHIAMGKQSQNPGSYGMMPMMGMMSYGGYGMMGTGNNMGNYNWPLGGTQLNGVHTFLMIVTWVSLITFLLAGARWFWKRANK